MEKRHHPRFKVNLPVTFTGTVKGTGSVRNLSTSGCWMQCMTDIPCRACLVLKLRLSGEETPLTIHASSARRCHEGGFNVAFLVMDTKEQERLRLYLSRLEAKEQHKDRR